MTPLSTALYALLSTAVAIAQTTWRDENGARSASANSIGSGKAGFTLMPPAHTGVSFANTLAESRSLTNQIYLNGSGVAAGDVDADGLSDLYFAALDRPGALYRNLGNWRFEEVAASRGLPSAPMDSTAVALSDLDGDGDLDLIFNTVGRGTHIYANDGQGRFTAATPASGLNVRKGGMSLALADIDGDGDLDVYIANYRTVTLRDEPNTRFSIRMVDGKPTVAAINGRPASDPDLKHRFTYTFSNNGGRGTFAHEENGEPDAILRNEGGLKFTEVPISGALFSDADGRPFAADWLELDWGLSVMFRDINQDGAPDIYVCNDFKSPDRLWLNDGRGNFRAAPRLTSRKMSLSSMGVDFADINRDGFDDFFVADMLSRERQRRITQMGDARPDQPTVGEIDNCPTVAQNTLFLNGGDGAYQEIAQFAGVEATEWTWSVAFLDVDLDGYEDLLVCNGFERDNMNMDVLRQMDAAKAQRQMTAAEQLEMRKLFPRLNTPNLALRNRGNLRFEEASKQWNFNAPAVSIGMALADLDNDGDLDVVVNNLNDPAIIYRNDSPAPRIAVQLKGMGGNSRGIGARVELIGSKMTQSQEVIAGGRYLSSDQPLRAFAALDAEATLKVRWRSGKESIIAGVKPNRIYEVSESHAHSGPPIATQRNSTSRIRFEDVSARINHTHRDEPFDDFARQPLLPYNYSQFGPGVSWFDIDRDGWDDLLIASGKGGQMGVYRNGGNGSFTPVTHAPYNAPITRDQTTLLGIVRNGQSVILAGSSHYEDGLPIMSGVRQFVAGAAKPDDSLPTLDGATGPLALADIDGDGDLDLFRGARCIPGKFPAPASSWIYKEQNGKLEVDLEASKAFAKIGLVSGAAFADLNDDGWPDLALACEWGPVHIFFNEKGRFVERTKELGFDKHLGWWNSVALGDFNNDGRLDVAAGNWGNNTKYESWRAQPLVLTHGDFDGDGDYDVVESHWEPASSRHVPGRNLSVLGKAMPLLKERFTTHAAFAQASLSDVVAAPLNATNSLAANCLETMIFLNRSDHFEGIPLPLEAQLSPVFGISVGDFDADGNEDLFLAQNFFAREPETPRCDAGWGLILRGKGTGDFEPLTPLDSGVRVAGEQRGSAVCDFDGDGKLDFVVAQNGAATRLFRNVSLNPGIRMRLKGPPTNPGGIGATVRVASQGPARAIQAGSGFWSNDSTAFILPKSSKGKSLDVRWPGGKVESLPIP